jgi:hypothetical protein
MGPNRFLTTVADTSGYGSTYLCNQGRSPNNRCSNSEWHRGPRLFGAKARRLRLLYQQQWASGAESMRELEDRRAAPKSNRNVPRWQL